MNAVQTCQSIANHIENHAKAMLMCGTSSQEINRLLIGESIKALSVGEILTEIKSIAQTLGYTRIIQVLECDLPNPLR